MRDFTPATYCLLLDELSRKGYAFCTFEEFMTGQPSRAVVLRHDVDKHPHRALVIAELEHARRITASYHIRVTSDRGVHAEASILEKITGMGHEIAYHYEDLSRALDKFGRSWFRPGKPEDLKAGVATAKESFDKNLELLRQYYPVRVISMHGDPLSRHDNRDLWKYIDYHDFGITCESYLDIDYSGVTYLTDTGRCWDAGRSNRRDRIPGKTKEADLFSGQPHSTTYQLISLIRSGSVKSPMVINTHPQRWSGNLFIWLQELTTQNIKNIIKAIT